MARFSRLNPISFGVRLRGVSLQSATFEVAMKLGDSV